ncbi:YidH family protein [Nocardioides allogilvus]|uniref:YidH family protein n=1 Tax=Nocardioides allogilvus TaxID=2072017 RepID=UPI000D30BCA9|nr:DUF202 domain-containing protein [Nocardioides allogilvus]
MTRDDRRWPDSVYGVGDEPDARVSLANERTLLAWVRTSLALIAGGVAVDALGLAGAVSTRPWLAVLLIVIGLAAAVGGWFRWMAAERAIRLRHPLLSARLPLVVVLGVVVVGLGLVAVVLWG